ncbi:uncharacterized protein M6G45_015455 isoform 1-T1 [Spheniscus humboldti]
MGLYKHPPAFLSIQQLPLREFALCILDNHFPVLISFSNVSFRFASLQKCPPWGIAYRRTGLGHSFLVKLFGKPL